MSLLLLFPSSAAAPVDLTGIDTAVYGSPCTVTGTGFGASQGTITLDGQEQVITAWSDTSVTFTVDRGDSRYGGVTVTLFNAGATSSDSIIGALLTPPAGWAYADLADPLASSGQRLTALPDLAGGDQVAYGNVQGSGSIVTGVAGVEVYTDASTALDEWVTAFDAEAHDGVEWGAVATQRIGVSVGAAGPARSPIRSPIRSAVRGTIH